MTKYQNNLTGFDKYFELVGENSKKEFNKILGLSEHSSVPLVNSRYKFARTFEGIKTNVSDYEPTIEGWEVLLKLFFAFSALEEFIRLLGIYYIKDKWNSQLEVYINEKHKDKLHKAYIKAYPKHELLKYLIFKSKGSLKNNLQDLVDNNAFHVIWLSFGVRNTFSHGNLVPYTNYLFSNKMKRSFISSLADTILDLIDDRFLELINNFSKEVG